MLQTRIGKVISIKSEDEAIQNLVVDIDGTEYKAVNYVDLCGKVAEDDKLILNTTAVTLGLGTGGVHFCIANLNNPVHDPEWDGHIMKLRYTPMQVKCNVLEEIEQYHDVFEKEDSIEGVPVCIATLHSMLPPIVLSIKDKKPDAKICYIMTDGAALPLKFSRLVKGLKEKKLIDDTITIGHAFGGDYECINIYSALIAAKHILKADAIVVTMGPGIVGSNSKFGFTGIEQGYLLDAVNSLGGHAVACPRISFADKRERHYGLSHHSITTFTKAVHTQAEIIFSSSIEDKKKDYIHNQIVKNEIDKKHKIVVYDEDTANLLQKYNIKVTTMGRNFEQDSELFQNAGACGNYIVDKYIK